MAKASVHHDDEFERQYERATREAREADRVEPRAAAASYDATRGLVLVEMRNGFVFGFAPERVPGLESASSRQLRGVTISPSGDGLHWDKLDVHASLAALVAEAFQIREWSARILGQSRTEAKARASRLNGMKGGRPRQTSKRTTKST